MLTRDYLEYGVVEHCNLKCDGCTVFAPHLEPFFTELSSFERDVKELAKSIYVKRFRLLGGEPMLHKQILDFVKVVKASGLAKRVGICSNGELAEKMSDEFYKTIDFLDISVYPTSRIDYIELKNFLEEKKKQFGLVYKMMEHKKDFRITNVDQEITDKNKVQDIYNRCEIAHSWSCHHFYDGYYYKCAKPIYQNKYFDRVGIKTDIDYRQVDGIAIHEPNFAERLQSYVNGKTPLRACSFCYGTIGEKYPNRQLTQQEIQNKLAK